MLGIGFFEIVIIALVCFIALGPKQLPIVMRKLAVFYRQFILLKDEFRFQLMNVEHNIKEESSKSIPDAARNEKTTTASKENHG